MSNFKIFKILLSVVILLLSIYEFSTFSLIDGLMGPVGGGGILIIGGVYLVVGIIALVAAIYLIINLSSLSKYIAYGLLIIGVIVIALLLLFTYKNTTPEYKKHPYDKEIINSIKLCPQVTYACLSETKNDAWKKTLLATEFNFYSRDLLWVQLRAIEKLFDYYKVDIDTEEERQNLYDLLRDKVFEHGASFEHKSKDIRNDKMVKRALLLAAKYMNKSAEEVLLDKIFQRFEKEEKELIKKRRNKLYFNTSNLMDVLYPDFWGNTLKDEQIKWVMQVERIAKKNEPNSENGTVTLMAIICGMIGVDFERKLIHKPVADYLSSVATSSAGGQLSYTLRYLTFVYLERDYDLSGRRFYRGSIASATTYLPWPKKRLKWLSDLKSEEMYDEPSDMWKLYKYTIKNEEESNTNDL